MEWLNLVQDKVLENNINMLGEYKRKKAPLT